MGLPQRRSLHRSPRAERHRDRRRYIPGGGGGGDNDHDDHEGGDVNDGYIRAERSNTHLVAERLNVDDFHDCLLVLGDSDDQYEDGGNDGRPRQEQSQAQACSSTQDQRCLGPRRTSCT